MQPFMEHPGLCLVSTLSLQRGELWVFSLLVLSSTSSILEMTTILDAQPVSPTSPTGDPHTQKGHILGVMFCCRSLEILNYS